MVKELRSYASRQYKTRPTGPLANLAQVAKSYSTVRSSGPALGWFVVPCRVVQSYRTTQYNPMCTVPLWHPMSYSLAGELCCGAAISWSLWLAITAWEVDGDTTVTCFQAWQTVVSVTRASPQSVWARRGGGGCPGSQSGEGSGEAGGSTTSHITNR